MKLVTEKSGIEEKNSTVNPLSCNTAVITILAGPNKGQYFKLSPAKPVTLGRGSASDVQIMDKGLSRCHANIFYKDGKIFVEDLQSTNGTYVNKKKYTDPIEIKHGDKVFLGSGTFLVLVVKDSIKTQQAIKPKELTRDPLTNLLDNQSCLRCLQQVYRDSTQHDSPFCMLMIKIDDFDQVKDSFGTIGGDQVLIQMAKILSDLARQEDYVCHFSKEVFLIVCPDFDALMGIDFAENIRSTVEDYAFMHKTYQIRVTASIGISNYPDNGIQSETQIVEFAHNALHHAEKSGKNSTSMA